MKKSIKPLLMASLLAISASYAISATSAPFGPYADGCRYANNGPSMQRGPGCMRQRGFMPGGKGRAAAGGQHRLLGRLDLSQQQWDQVRAIDKAYDETFRELQTKLQGNRQALRTLNSQPSVDQQDIAQLARTRGDLVEEKVMLRADRRARVHALLTDEQRANWNALRQQRQRRWQ